MLSVARYLPVVAVLIVWGAASAAWAQQEAGETVMAAETGEARDARMAWWREARFGMFVHWGLYSGLGGNWQGRSTGAQGGMEWIQNAVKADTWEYAHEAIPLFRPKPGFAGEWASLAREAGCRYVVFTSKHHEGFALFNSQYTDYDGFESIATSLPCAFKVFFDPGIRGTGLVRLASDHPVPRG